MKKTLLTLSLLAAAAAAHAVNLTPGAWTALPGTTVATEPQLAGTVLEDSLTSFSFAAYGGMVSGTVQSRSV